MYHFTWNFVSVNLHYWIIVELTQYSPRKELDSIILFSSKKFKYLQ